MPAGVGILLRKEFPQEAHRIAYDSGFFFTPGGQTLVLKAHGDPATADKTILLWAIPAWVRP